MSSILSSQQASPATNRNCNWVNSINFYLLHNFAFVDVLFPLNFFHSLALALEQQSWRNFFSNFFLWLLRSAKGQLKINGHFQAT